MGKMEQCGALREALGLGTAPLKSSLRTAGMARKQSRVVENAVAGRLVGDLMGSQRPP